jgi:hypothetical protein
VEEGGSESGGLREREGRGEGRVGVREQRQWEREER